MKVHIRRHTHPRLLIQPAIHRWIHLWDAFQAAVVIFVAIVTPIELCMNKVFVVGIIAYANLAACAFFGLDILVNFVTAYREQRASGARWVLSHRKIAHKYVTTWFLLDLIVSIPYDLPLVLGYDMGEVQRAVSAIKLLRIAKLMPIISNMVDVFSRMGLTFATATMTRFMVVTLLVVHYLACAWAFVGLFWTPSAGSLANEKPWIVAYGFEDYSPSRLYAVCTYVVIVAIFGGVSNIAPHNFMEYGMLSVIMMIGGVVWAHVISSLCGLVASLNPRGTAFKNQMDELAEFCRDRNFDPQHRRRMRDFFYQTQDAVKEQGFQNLFERMSTRLRSDTALLVGQRVLANVWYLRPSSPAGEVEQDFLGQVAINMVHTIYETGEKIVSDRLVVITRGIVARRVRILSRGHVIGDDCIIQDCHHRLRQRFRANCLSFVQCSSITSEELFRLSKEFPLAARTMARASIRMTMCAALLGFFRNHMRQHRERRLSMSRLEFYEVVEAELRKAGGRAYEDDVAEAHVKKIGTDAARDEKIATMDAKLDRLEQSMQALIAGLAAAAPPRPARIRRADTDDELAPPAAATVSIPGKAAGPGTDPRAGTRRRAHRSGSRRRALREGEGEGHGTATDGSPGADGGPLYNA